jgi:protoporphyrinogen/coproporphyrinogen III oxidase
MSGRVVVVGAGISGLTAAYRLRRAGHEVRVLEAWEYVGGRMSTARDHGYVMDRGASVLSSRYAETLALIAELGLSDQVRCFNDQIGFYRDGRVYRCRSRHPAALGFRRLLSLRSKLAAVKLVYDTKRMARHLDFSDMSGTAGLDSESVREYCDRRLTAELRDYIVDPTMRSLYQGTIDDFASTELFWLIEKFLGGGLLNHTSGIDFLARALADQVDVTLGATVTAVEERERGVTVAWRPDGGEEQIEEADACVITATARQMARLYPQLDEERRAIIGSLTYNQLWSVALGVDPVPAETAVFVQIPTVEHPDLDTAVFEHNKAPGRAPAGKGLLNSYWLTRWYERHADCDDERIAALTAHGLSMIVPGIEDHVEYFHVTRWNPALLLAKPGTWQALARFHELTPRTGRVQFAGDYFGGSSTNSALASGERVAEILLDGLVGRRGIRDRDFSRAR